MDSNNYRLPAVPIQMNSNQNTQYTGTNNEADQDKKEAVRKLSNLFK